MAGDRGCQRHMHPLNPTMQARLCRQMAADMRQEAAMGWPPIILAGQGSVSRLAAAESMDARAARWEAELQTGILNHQDRRSMGF